MLLERPCHGAARATAPLFADAEGRLLAHSTLDRIHNELLAHCFDDRIAATRSWHSYRIGLACSLHATGASDAQVQLMCRWMSPDSLRLYRRLGTAEMTQLVDAAEEAVIDTLQSGSVPLVDQSEGFAALQDSFGAEGPLAARQSELLDAMERLPGTSPSSATSRGGVRGLAIPATDSDDDEPPPTAAEADTRPLTRANAEGRRVLVPRELWPEYPCDEHGGAGWEGTVLACKSWGSRVSFTYATSSSGLPFADSMLQLDALRPL